MVSNLNSFQHEAQYVEDRMALSGLLGSCKLESSDDDDMDLDDTANYHPRAGPTSIHSRYEDSNRVAVRTGATKRELKQRPVSNGWLQKTVCMLLSDIFVSPLVVDLLISSLILPNCIISTIIHCHFVVCFQGSYRKQKSNAHGMGCRN